MVETNNTATLQSVLRFALPLGTTLIVGDPLTPISWAATIRAQPPAFPDIYGGELALVSMDVVRSYDNRISVIEVIQSLAEVKIAAIAVDGDVTDESGDIATKHGLALLALPKGSGLAGIERAVNKLILNQEAQLNERAMEIQRQLTRLVAENRDLNSLLQVVARATTHAMVIHDDAGVLLAQVYGGVSRRPSGGRLIMQNLPYSAFQRWLENDPPRTHGVIVNSPLGFTTVLTVEKRVAGYLSLVSREETIDDFNRLVMTYGADVCAIELAKSRAIATAVEQTRGDWVQMWLSGTSSDDDLLTSRAQQAGFDPMSDYIVAIFKAVTSSGQSLPLESLLTLVRDDMSRRNINGAVGQYVDVIVALYPMDESKQVARVHIIVDELRQQLASRSPSGLVSAGISRATEGLTNLRQAYKEAKNAISIAQELGDNEVTTYYGDLKLYQLLLALKENHLENLLTFYEETLAPLVEQDERKQSDLVRTLTGFFEANGNLAQAAKDLSVHRNTLVYRLERISELTDLNLDEADNRLILHLGLKILRVLATIQHQSAT